MDLIYGTSTFDQSRGNLIQLPVVNMYVEQAPSEQRPVLLSRPGINTTGIAPMGAGPVTCLFQTDGVLGGNIFGISNGNLYEDPGTLIGAMDGSDIGTICCFPTRIFANQGGNVYTYDGTTFASVTVPGGFLTTDICVGGDRLILLQKDTGTFWWSDILSTNVDGLSFATAESSCDNLLDCLYIGDTLFLFGSNTVEMWPVTTDGTAPFQPLIGSSFSIGIKGTHCAAAFNNTFAWITNKNTVCLTNPSQVISSPALEEHLSNETAASVWTFRLEGTEFLAVRLNTLNKTYVYSSKSGMWSEFRSYNFSNFVPMCYCRTSTGAQRFGSSVDGKLYQWGSDYSDTTDASHVIERIFRAGYPIDGGVVPLNNVLLRMNPGQGIGIIQMRTSKNGGSTWGNYVTRELTLANTYRSRIQWRSCGRFGHPGILCEFYMGNNIPLRVSGVTANESYADIGV